MRAVLLALLGWFVACLAARADDGVVLFQRDALRADLCTALRIQLSGLATLRCEAEQGPSLLSERLALAAGKVRAGGIRLGVLLERDPDPRRIRMYILSGRADQAVIAIERIEDRGDPDIDRSLALKVRDAYEVIGFVQTAAPAKGVSLASAIAPSAARSEVPPAEPAASSGADPKASAVPQPPPWLSFVDVGGGLNMGAAGLRAVSSVALGLSRADDKRRLELGVGARLYSRRSEQEDLGRASSSERGPLLSARLLYRWGRIELGAAVEALLSFVSAQGTANDGTHGEKRLLTFGLGLGAELRVRLFSSAYLRFSPNVEFLTVRRRLAVEQKVLIDEGYVRGSLPLSLIFMLPLGKVPEDFQP